MNLKVTSKVSLKASSKPGARRRPAPPPREPRVPLYVQAVTQPPLLDCWSVNISSTGLGLVARWQDPGRTLTEGDELDVELQLPGSRTRIRARCRLAWCDEPAVPEGPISLGAEFVSLPDRDRLELNRHLHAHRFHVAVAFASRAELDRLSWAFDSHTRAHTGNTEAEIDAILDRGDISVLVVCGKDERRLVDLITRVGDRFRRGERGPLGVQDHAPRVIVFARIAPARLVDLFNRGYIYRALSPEADAGLLAEAIGDACRDIGVRTEQWRVSVALERALLRERARARRPAQLGRIADEVVAESEPMQHVMEQLRLVAPHRMVVLLHGETGTGKEVLARAIHRLSERAHAPFVVQDCGALPETLLDSELFGHVRGAFTGAHGDHAGLFSMADGGTIFLDEIENTSAALQAKLLRVIETGEIRPVGGTRVRQVDARRVVASNRDLREEEAAGRFRSDLYYRISTFPIEVPPLRERAADILPLARRFLSSFAASLGQEPPPLEPAAEAAL